QRLAALEGDPLVVEDLSTLHGAQRAGAARRRVEAWAATPFALARERAFKVLLLRLGADEHQLLLVTHHAMADGWSVGVLLRDLAALYGAEAMGAGTTLLPVPVQYRAFAAWQRDTRGASWLDAEL